VRELLVEERNPLDWITLFSQWLSAIVNGVGVLAQIIAHWLTTLGGTGNPLPPAGGVSPADTPEFGSLTLFGTGLFGAGAYVVTRFRARSRPS
jgi:hypothetical protein